ncbi:MAG: 3-dehydroquinate synthase [Actinomycetota bacterium]
MSVTRISVELGDRSYPVLVGHGAVDTLASLVPSDVRRIAVVTEDGIPIRISTHLPSAEIRIAGGESAKNLSTIEMITRRFAEFGLTRRDLVIGVGGGLVTDVAGFAASVWHRGTRVIHVPTTLLAMVDAAIGGKTAVNLPEGKNLVGAFWQPIAVVADLDALRTLPDRETKCGLGEVAKYHFLTGDDLLSLPLQERIGRCVRIKADIVAEDETESGRRMLLNYGHTLGHALEICGAHRLAHGEAVAVGLLYAARLARALDRIDDERVDFHDQVVRREYGLADDRVMDSIRDLSVLDLLAAMKRDKKATDGLTFVLDGPHGPEVVSDVPDSVVEASLQLFLTQ